MYAESLPANWAKRQSECVPNRMLQCCAVRVQVKWMQRQLLHAVRMRVTHPRTHQPLLLQAPLPEDFEHALSKLGMTLSPQLPDMPL